MTEHEIEVSRDASKAHHKMPWGQAALLIGLYLSLRLPHLRDMPVFCDEATYIRWAQLIHIDPLHHLWISMQDAKFPLHYWLLALFYSIHPDPIYTARLFSVLCGAATIPFFLVLASEIRHLAAARGSAISVTAARLFGPLASLFMITSPMADFFQRMALAESLLQLEAVAIACMSLRLARLIVSEAGRWRLLFNALTLGILWGATLLTKQNFSYLLWMLPPLAMAIYWRGRDGPKNLFRFFSLFANATCMGLLLFIPVLLRPSLYSLQVKLFYKPFFFIPGNASRMEMVGHNISSLVLPESGNHFQFWPYGDAQPPDSGILYLYLTPPICLILILGMGWLAWRKSYVVPLFLALWSLLLLGPLAGSSNFIVSRFAFLGTIPLILLAAWIVSEMAIRLRLASSISRATFLSVLLAWPAMATLTSTFNYRATALLRGDRAEYLTNASAGCAVEQATQWLSARAAEKPLTLLTGERLGVLNDYSWITLRNNPNVQLLGTDRTRLPMPPFPQPSTLDVITEQWLIHQTASITVPSERPVYRMVEMDLNEHGFLHLAVALAIISPYARVEHIFLNPPLGPGDSSSSGLAIVRIDAPEPTPVARAR